MDLNIYLDLHLNSRLFTHLAIGGFRCCRHRLVLSLSLGHICEALVFGKLGLRFGLHHSGAERFSEYLGQSVEVQGGNLLAWDIWGCDQRPQLFKRSAGVDTPAKS